MCKGRNHLIYCLLIDYWSRTFYRSVFTRYTTQFGRVLNECCHDAKFAENSAKIHNLIYGVQVIFSHYLSPWLSHVMINHNMSVNLTMFLPPASTVEVIESEP